MFSVERWIKELVDNLRQHDKRLSVVERKEIPSVINKMAGGRLTLTSGTPIVNSITGATTLYYTPYVGNQISLLISDNVWSLKVFTELSISLADLVADTNYDVFIYDNEGVPTLVLTAWASGSARASAVSYYDGILVKTSDPYQRYIGTIRANSTGGQVDDTFNLRGVWNMYNREPRNLYKFDATAHTYNLAATRAWNNDATFRVAFVIGIANDVRGEITGMLKAGADGSPASISAGLDSTTANAFISYCYNYINQYVSTSAGGYLYVAEGYHYFQALEGGDPTNPASFAHLFLKGMILG